MSSPEDSLGPSLDCLNTLRNAVNTGGLKQLLKAAGHESTAEVNSSHCTECGQLLRYGQPIFDTDEDAHLCEACAEAVMAKQPKECSFCDEPFADGDPVYKSRSRDTFACDKCMRAAMNASSERPTHCRECQANLPFVMGKSEDLCPKCLEAQRAKPQECSSCGAAFAGSDTFYRSQTEQGNEQLLCTKCVEARLPVCPACRSPVNGAFGRLAGETYHASCLQCAVCNVALGGNCTRTPQGLVCKNCAEGISNQVRQITELLQNGDVAGAAHAAAKLQSCGVKLPGALLEILDAHERQLSGCNSGDQVEVDLAEQLQDCSFCKGPFVPGELFYRTVDIGDGEGSQLSNRLVCLKCSRCLVCFAKLDGECSKMSHGFVCRACGRSIAERVQEESKELLQKGDMEGAAKIFEGLSAQGVDVPSGVAEFLAANQGSSCSKCAAALKVGQEVYRSPETGELSFLCELCWKAGMPVCASCKQTATGELRKLGDNVYHLECSRCLVCSKGFEGECAQMPRGFVCKDCAQNIAGLAQESKELCQNGDVVGAAKSTASLQVSPGDASGGEE